MKTRISVISTLLVCASLFASCVSGVPNENDGMKVMKEKIEQESRGAITLAEFTKTNGVYQEVFGVAYYEMEYSMIIQFKRDCWKGGNAFEGHFSDFTVLDAIPTGWAAWNIGSVKGYHKGERITLTGKLNFEKAENGWRYKK